MPKPCVNKVKACFPIPSANARLSYGSPTRPILNIFVRMPIPRYPQLENKGFRLKTPSRQTSLCLIAASFLAGCANITPAAKQTTSVTTFISAESPFFPNRLEAGAGDTQVRKQGTVS